MEHEQNNTLMTCLKQIPDPRHDQGKQYAWPYLLAIIATALLSGCRTGRAIAHWARLHTQELLVHLQPQRPQIPSAATFY